MQVTGETRTFIQFGRFQVHPHRRELLMDGVPVRLGDRAFDILLVLIEARGKLVTKDELLNRVWPGIVVEGINLSVQVSALRKALEQDRDFLKTISGRGYRFVAEVTTNTVEDGAGSDGNRAAPYATALAAPRTNLPVPTSDMIGREAELKEVLDLAAGRRLVTLTGAGGIGKTRLGIEAARHLLPKFTDGVWLAELAPLTDSTLVPATVASALGLTLASGTLSPERVVAALGTRQLLLVLDNCEHVIEAAAHMADALLRASPLISVMATSREPLRAEGECVYQVPPLDVPLGDAETNEQVLRHGAVKLFIARARAAESQFSTDKSVAAMAAICRHLDGIPLAIELAAARSPALGIEGLASRLDDRFKLLTGGHRTALPRHQTLRATLDWSYELLPEGERIVLRRLAIFAGSFTLESAGMVVGGDRIDAADVVDYVTNLVSKSLVTADVGSATAQYRMLETTRAYALEKLVQSDEIERLARRHAEYLRDVFERAETEWQTQPTAEWLAAYGRHTDNVRAALDWAFSPTGDITVGVALTAAAVPLWMHMSLIEECRARVERALANLEPGASGDSRRKMQLLAALGTALLYSKGPGLEINAVWTNVLRIAESLGDIDYRLRALWGLWADRSSTGQFRESLAFAESFCNFAASSSDPGDRLIGDRIIGMSLHFLGRQIEARYHLERMLSRYVPPIHRAHIIRFQFEQRVTAQAALARVLWFQGFPDRAMRTAESSVNEARTLHHTLSLCNALSRASAVALLAGDFGVAEHFIEELLDQSARHALASWQAEGRCFQGVLLIRRGDAAKGVQVLRSTLEEFSGNIFALRRTALLGDLAEALGHAGEMAQGLKSIDEALERSDRNEERWCIAELLRIKGELLLREDASGAAAKAEELFREGLAWASRQGALSWELRCAISLTQMWQRQARNGEGLEVLAPIYGRFTEGFETADLKSAKMILEA